MATLAVTMGPCVAVMIVTSGPLLDSRVTWFLSVNCPVYMPGPMSTVSPGTEASRAGGTAWKSHSGGPAWQTVMTLFGEADRPTVVVPIRPNRTSGTMMMMFIQGHGVRTEPGRSDAPTTAQLSQFLLFIVQTPSSCLTDKTTSWRS
jgi:hypothetical protein